MINKLNAIMNNLIGLSALTSTQVSNLNGVVLHRGPTLIPSWNTVYLPLEPTHFPRRLFDAASRFFSGTEYRVTTISEEGAIAVSFPENSGLRLFRSLDILVRDMDEYPADLPALPKWVEIEESMIPDWTDIFVRVFLRRRPSKKYWEIFERAREVKRLVAMVGGRPAAIISYYSKDGLGQIGSVATLKRFRRLGLAKLLIYQALATRPTGDKNVYLTVDPRNTFEKFYLSHGFSRVGQQHYYSKTSES